MFGSIEGRRVRKALDTQSWETGEEKLRKMDPYEPVGNATVTEACDSFVKDCEARNLGKETIGKYKLLTRELKERFKGPLRSVTIDDLRKYRESWGMGPLSAQKKLERLRTFFKFCHESGWVRSNPATILKSPKVTSNPTLPFNNDEMEKILWAVDLFPKEGWHGTNKRKRLRAFVLMLRYSGMRIGDVATLSKDKINGNKLFLYTAKTKTPVNIPLPKEVIKALDEIDEGNRYYFWSGNGTVRSAKSAWQRSLKKLFRLAGIKNGFAHRFRDTFSVSLLESGVALETVSVLLGHSNSRITAKHYNPWVQSRQVALEAEIEKAWAVQN
jgi:integrase/recombinase XerD